MKVLIIEDDRNIQQFLLAALKRLNPTIHISLTDNATKALIIAQEQYIDFLLSIFN